MKCILIGICALPSGHCRLEKFPLESESAISIAQSAGLKTCLIFIYDTYIIQRRKLYQIFKLIDY